MGILGKYGSGDDAIGNTAELHTTQTPARSKKTTSVKIMDRKRNILVGRNQDMPVLKEINMRGKWSSDPRWLFWSQARVRLGDQ